jgi:hypothetical protein
VIEGNIEEKLEVTGRQGRGEEDVSSYRMILSKREDTGN